MDNQDIIQIDKEDKVLRQRWSKTMYINVASVSRIHRRRYKNSRTKKEYRDYSSKHRIVIALSSQELAEILGIQRIHRAEQIPKCAPAAS